ncbi:hypothetical protein GCM10020370_18290 [Paenibacillus hodogayensis]
MHPFYYLTYLLVKLPQLPSLKVEKELGSFNPSRVSRYKTVYLSPRLPTRWGLFDAYKLNR